MLRGLRQGGYKALDILAGEMVGCVPGVLDGDKQGEKMTLNFLRAALAQALICSIMGDEKPKSAPYNRASNAQDAILRYIDLSLPPDFDETQLNELYALLDGPVNDLLTKELERFHNAA